MGDEIRETDLRVEVFSNSTDTYAVRILHVPTGLVGSAEGRGQVRAKAEALGQIHAQLARLTPDPTPAAPAGVGEPYTPEYERAYNDGVREQAYWTHKAEGERNEARAKLDRVRRVAQARALSDRAVATDTRFALDVLAILDEKSRPAVVTADDTTGPGRWTRMTHHVPPPDLTDTCEHDAHWCMDCGHTSRALADAIARRDTDPEEDVCRAAWARHEAEIWADGSGGVFGILRRLDALAATEAKLAAIRALEPQPEDYTNTPRYMLDHADVLAILDGPTR